MISHCANPECAVPLRYLRHGRIFRFDVPSSQFGNSSKNVWRTSHFWLCGRCCQRLTLMSDPLGEVVVRQLEDTSLPSTITIKLPTLPPARPPQVATAHA
jgi:hypothetical protein